VGGFSLVLALALLAVYVGVRAFLIADLDAQLRTLAGTELASAVDEAGDAIHLHEFPVDSTQAEEYAGKFVQLIDGNGRVLMQSPVLGTRPALLDQARLRQGFAGAAPLVPVDVNGRPGRMIALRTAGPDRYLVAVGLFTDTLDRTLSRLGLLLAGVWLTALGVTAVLGFTLASSALAPIRRITRQASTIAQGQFEQRLDEPALQDEIGEMTGLLNEMLARLHAAIEVNRRFAADASHELRSPLTAMLGELDVTLKRERTADEYRDTMGRLRERLVAMTTLADDLTLLVRAQERRSVNRGEVALRPLVDRVLARVAQAADEAGVRIASDVAPDLVAYADARLLERVVDNLFSNALLHGGAGGQILVNADLERADAREGWVADHVVLRVRDFGPGIPQDARERVFERFFRLDPSRSRRTGGSGLGLAISREIVELFGGTIRVADTEGPGATLEVRLPGGVVA
jgi:two-component system OmpR family sensor kinase